MTVLCRAAKQMKSINPDAAWVKGLMGTAAVASRGYEGARSAKAWLLQNPMALVALLMILLAVVLRAFGVM